MSHKPTGRHSPLANGSSCSGKGDTLSCASSCDHAGALSATGLAQRRSSSWGRRARWLIYKPCMLLSPLPDPQRYKAGAAVDKASFTPGTGGGWWCQSWHEFSVPSTDPDSSIWDSEDPAPSYLTLQTLCWARDLGAPGFTLLWV